jgi:hypothetical protein
MKEIKNIIENTNSNQFEMGLLSDLIDRMDLDDKIRRVEHERDDGVDPEFTQYFDMDTQAKVPHESLVGFELLIDGEWELVLFKNITFNFSL